MYKFTHLCKVSAQPYRRNESAVKKFYLYVMTINRECIGSFGTVQKRKEKTTPFGINLMRSQGHCACTSEGYKYFMLM